MSGDETRPVDIGNMLGGATENSWQSNDTAWSFGFRSRHLFSAGDSHLPNGDPALPNKNANGSGTSAPQRVTVPDLTPVAPPDRRLGLKAWRALSHWEGVVEEVTGDGFQLRLTPFVEGRPDFTRPMFAEFGFDELAYEADRDLIVRDAVVYWTVGRRRDEAGTFSNQSLVRVRRQAPPSGPRKQLAAQEVADLLADAWVQE